MRQLKLYPEKNDFFFALLVTAVFAVCVVGAVAGSLDLARGRVGVDYAKTRGAPVALGDARKQAPQVARAGPER